MHCKQRPEHTEQSQQIVTKNEALFSAGKESSILKEERKEKISKIYNAKKQSTQNLKLLGEWS